MPLGPRITQDVRWQIAQVYLAHPDWRAKEVMVEVQARLRQRNAHIKPNWPGLSAVQTELKKIRDRRANEPQERKGLDGGWNMATLDKHPIPPEALWIVLQLWKGCVQRNVVFTIREATWAARLYLAVERRVGELEEKRQSLKLKGDDLDFISHYVDLSDFLPEKIAQEVIPDAYTEALYTHARRYARVELIYEIIGEPFDTNILDRLLMGLRIPTDTIESTLPEIADQEEDRDRGVKDGVEQIRELKKKHGLPPGFLKRPSISPEKEESHERSHRKEG